MKATQQKEIVHEIRSIESLADRIRKKKKKRKKRIEYLQGRFPVLDLARYRFRPRTPRQVPAFARIDISIVCARWSIVWPEASTWMVLQCNSFEIGFGFPRDCFDLG